ncbi:hypothetical protein L486_04466 [Kwoniella mangroviensis CBS 10435]|uniref:Uncharacterized protein n=1 Tax=Kwoniella mangroviensis CBS 10435 TaxID=1331196 RepID=A0A1B9ISB3_9TREE|nr:hypothetical protein L486_04466 [Kwoniella mangroviensis CBS 10435]
MPRNRIITGPSNEDDGVVVQQMDERLLQLAATIGIKPSMLCYITRHHDLKVNPIASEVYHVLSLVDVKAAQVALDHAGVRKLSKTEQKKVKETYFKNHKNRTQIDFVRESDRIQGWKIIAKANEAIRTYFGHIGDRALFELFHVDQTKRYDLIRQIWKNDLEDARIETVAGIIRWCYGSVLGYLMHDLNAEKSPTSGLTPRIVNQTYDPIIKKDFGGPARMAREWFSGPFITTELAQGRGLLPFHPFCEAHYPAAVKMRAHDAGLVDELFETACKNHGIDTSQGVYEITSSPYEYVRYHQRDATLGMKLMREIIREVQQRSNRVAGPVGLVWQCIADYLDQNACLNEKRRLWAANENPNPLDMMRAAPESSQKKLRSSDIKDKAIVAFKKFQESSGGVTSSQDTHSANDDSMQLDDVDQEPLSDLDMDE